MENRTFVVIDVKNQEHCNALLALLNDYMEDEMGAKQTMSAELGPKIIQGIKEHPAYLGFLVKMGDNYAALANCNLNYSTWQARFLINIHDFVVSPKFREQGIGEFLLNEMETYAKNKGYSKLNLEVRNDNLQAQRLYKKVGYNDFQPPMFFWQKKL